MTEQNDLPHSVGGMLDKIMEEQGFSAESLPLAAPETPVRMEERQPAPTEPPVSPGYLSFFDGDREIQVPKSARTRLSTKAGDAMEISAEEMANAPWSKRENSRLVNEKIALERHYNETIQKYKDIFDLTSDQAKDFRGAEWTAQTLKAITQLDPSRLDDIKEFVTALQNGGLSDTQLKESELQRKQIELEKKAKHIEHAASLEHLESYTSQLSSQLVDTLGIDPQQAQSRIAELAQQGALPSIKDVPSANQAASAIYQHLLVDKALATADLLGLSDEEFKQCQGDMLGLLTANPRISPQELAPKLGAMIGRNPSSRAQAKIDAFAEARGRRPESRSPKPPLPDYKIKDITKLSPFEFIERTTGHSYN